jgi:prophage tail gpP-like protein
MPNPTEIATVRGNGQKYDIWETVEVHRAVASVSGTINHALLTVSEISTGGTGFTSLKLTIGDVVGIDLAGINVIDGFVYLRQAAADDKTHAVQIGIASTTQAVVRTTVDVKPGSYTNQTVQQIGSACFGACGVGFSVVGSPSGADQPFKRVCEQLGESRFNFIERLCRMVNLHMLDSGRGTMLAFRGAQGNVSAELKEGVNILRARLLLQVDDHVETYGARSQDHNADSGPANAQVEADASAPSPGKPIGGTVKFGAEEALASGQLQLRANHQADYDALKTVDGLVTVQGWFAPDGELWWFKVGQTVTVNSPMLIPEGSAQFIIREIVHRQSSAEGTTTDVMITNPKGLGGFEAFGG